ncbi:MAG TPA: PRC-barrel domain-containing protein [Bacteroidales bacterium]|nr:PRC-barrel domain-containing protein [Bacteroidales bacterium]
MKYSVKDLLGYNIEAMDGTKANVKDILFDEETWIVRYLEADFGNVFNSKRILIPRALLKNSNIGSDTFFVDISKNDLERYPSPEDELTVSRRYEEELHRFYGIDNYWAMSYPYPGAGVTGGMGMNDVVSPRATRVPSVLVDESDLGTSLHSFNEVKGYNIQAVDGELGHIEDMIIDDVDWQIGYFVVDTSNWLPWSKKVILDISQIDDISFARKLASVNLHTETIKNAPEYDSSKPIDSQYEASHHDYYEKQYVGTH